MQKQLEIDFQKRDDSTQGKLIHFPVDRLTGRARHEARALFKRPVEKRRWHLERFVDQIRLAYLTDANSFQFAERQAHTYRHMIIDEIDRLAIMDYLFGSDDEAQSA